MQRISIWLATKKGERPLNPNLGCCIRDYINQPLTYAKVLDLKGAVERELKQVFPDYKVTNVRVEIPERNSVKVSAFIGTNSIEFLGNAASLNALESQLSRALVDLGMKRPY